MSSKTYVFRNAGVIDPRSITTFGVSSKEGKNPIGFFGTGLKYAIAVLLRLKCSVTIHSGGDTYEFSAKPTRIRVNDFDLVHMNDEPCGFTTELGKTWELWQAFRELACNAKDEGGSWDDLGYCEGDSPHAGETHVVVTGRAFDSVWAQRHSIILNSAPLSALADHAEIHAGRSEYLYYRGVRCHKLSRPSAYTYNVTRTMDLTEDRQFKYDWYAADSVCRAVTASHDAMICQTVVTADPQMWWEPGALPFPRSAPVSEVFKDTVIYLAKKFAKNLNPAARKLVQEEYLEDLLVGEELKLTRMDQVRLDKATGFLLKIGYDVSRYPIKVSAHLGEGVLGRAHQNVIYISKLAFEQGTKRLAGTIYEEFLHLSTGCQDCTYEMQNMLIDAIMSMGEQALGEVL